MGKKPYYMSDKLIKKFMRMGHTLVCKICQGRCAYRIEKDGECLGNKCPKFESGECTARIKSGQFVISKPSKYKGRKLYHAKCYEDSFLEIDEKDDDDD